ncbi:MAG: c-type cytochrome [Phycisphaerales bacterium]|jgi:mono/diheme cytochrome c family protein|nr:c-type cytochrome [Phycisphaerales bacterium]
MNRLIALLLLATAGCDWMPGRPTTPEVDRGNPTTVHGFAPLWATNCQGCHGENGTWGPARPLNDPLYQSLVTDQWLRTTIADGINGTLMPPHSTANGGWMTDEQIDAVVAGMRTNWGGTPPSYAAASPAIINWRQSPGNADRGLVVFNSYCSPCHGENGVGAMAGSPIDPSFLALASDQMIRATIVCGRPDVGMPDWYGNLNGKPVPQRDGLPPLTVGQVADLLAWITSHRVEFPGQPYPASGNNDPGFRGGT